MENPEEKEWIAQARSGDAAAFGRLISAYQKRIYAFLLGLTRNPTVADDLTQETFLRAWKGLTGFRGSSAFTTWLFQIAHNRARSWGRWQGLRNFRERTLGPGPAQQDSEAGDRWEWDVQDSSPDARPEERAMTAGRGRALAEAIDRLPDREKAVFMLRHLEDLPVKDVAQALEIAEGSVKAHASHAVEKLRRALKEHQ